MKLVRPVRNSSPHDLEPLLEDRRAIAERQPERLELAAHALLRIAHAGAEDRAPAGDLVERRPLEREVERVAHRADQAGRAQAHALGALRDRRQQRHRLVARLREQAVADPDRVEAELLDASREVEQRREVVVGRDQRLAVVQVDAELDRRCGGASAIGRAAPRLGVGRRRPRTATRAAGERSTRWGTSMCSSSSRAASGASSASIAARIARCSAADCSRPPRSSAELVHQPAHLGDQLGVHRLELARCPRRRTSRAVERAVDLEEARACRRAAAARSISVAHRVQLGLLLRAQARHRELDRQRLERLAHLVGVDEFLAREARDDRAAARDHRHESLGRELPERLAQRAAADPERARERGLAELGARARGGSRGSPRAGGRSPARAACGSRAARRGRSALIGHPGRRGCRAPAAGRSAGRRRSARR